MCSSRRMARAGAQGIEGSEWKEGQKRKRGLMGLMVNDQATQFGSRRDAPVHGPSTGAQARERWPCPRGGWLRKVT